MLDRLFQVTLVLSTLALCWLWMMIVHEFGHVVAAWMFGETVTKVVLHPLTISRTDTTHDKHPLLVVCGGPVLGSLIPLAGLLAVHFLRYRFVYLCRFFAGFCLIANGAYLGVGSSFSIGDAGDLARGVPTARDDRFRCRVFRGRFRSLERSRTTFWLEGSQGQGRSISRVGYAGDPVYHGDRGATGQFAITRAPTSTCRLHPAQSARPPVAAAKSEESAPRFPVVPILEN